MMNRLEFYFKGYDGLDLFCQSWTPEQSHGTLVVTHGLGEHSDWYDLLANGIEDSQYSIYAWDLRGHGRSEGRRGCVENFTEYSQDLKCLLNFLEQEQKISAQPTVLLGHSMGGLVTTHYLLHHLHSFVRAICYSSPLFGVTMETPTIKIQAAKLLLKLSTNLTLNNNIQDHDLTKDPEILKKYPADPLRHNRISPKLFLSMQEVMAEAMARAEEIQLPVLMQLSGLDPIVSTPDSERFFDKISTKDKKKIIYYDSLHEVFNDLDRKKVFADLTKFLIRIREN